MKKTLGLLILSLSCSSLFGYADLIVTLRKGDSRFILIGDIHESRTFIKTEQEPFFKKLIEKLNKIEKKQPNTVIVYHEGLYGTEKNHNNMLPLLDRLVSRLRGETSTPEHFVPDTNAENFIVEKLLEKRFEAKKKGGVTHGIIPLLMQYYYSTLASQQGTTLASLQFKHNYAFRTQNYDIREFGDGEGTVDERQKIYETIIDSILEELSPEYKQAYEALPTPPQTDDPEIRKNMILTRTGAAAMDLGLIEKLISEEFKPHSIFVVHAGVAHIEFLTALLKANGWELVDTIYSSNPKKWITSDPYLGIGLELFPFRAKPVDPETQAQIEADMAEAMNIKI